MANEKKPTNLFRKKIPIENLSYWNVEEQEAYYSFVEASIKRDLLNKD